MPCNNGVTSVDNSVSIRWFVPLQSSNASKFRFKSGVRDGERSPRKVSDIHVDRHVHNNCE